jgi:DNA-binding CsgD family transcriptional regulator
MSVRELPPDDWRLRIYGRGPSSGSEGRRRIRAGERARIIADQDNCCLYCEIPIGTTIRRKGRDVTLRAQWDHFIPYSYLARNPSANWALACHICNLIKSCRMFQTVQDARAAILPERIRRGCESPKASILRAMSEPSAARPTRRAARSPLGPRQTQVLECVAQGMSNVQISRSLGIKAPQVVEHLRGAVRAMGVATCHEAAEIAIKRGYITTPSTSSSERTEA